jgi:hypothetical protein
MKIEKREIPQADGRVRHLASILDDDGPDEMEIRRTWFLQTLANNPDILMCGGRRFQQMVIRHDGTRWVADMEAIEGKVRDGA